MESTVHIAAYEALRAENQALRENLALAREALQLAQKEAAKTREKLALVEYELAQLKRLVFGTKSERFVPEGGPDQLPLFSAGLGRKGAPTSDAAQAEEKAAAYETVTYRRSQKKKPVRGVLSSHLPREVIVIEPDRDTSGLRKIGEEVTETLDYRPAKLVVIRRVRPKYVDPGSENGGVIIGALPARPIEKGLAEAGLLAHVVIEKYVDHMPLYRQVQRFNREGIMLSSSTLGDWTTASADLLVPLYEALAKELREGSYIQADETPIQVQDEQKSGTTHRGYYWVYLAPLAGLVVVDDQQGRARDGPKAFLSGYQGALQSDGYAVYDTYDSVPGITSYGCWAHARRAFHEALTSSPDRATHALEEIGQLYAVEGVLREQATRAEERRRLRQEQAVPVFRRLKAYLEENPG